MSVLHCPHRVAGGSMGSGAPPTMTVALERAWDDYRSWAKRARVLQASSKRWKEAALGSAVVGAFLAAAATQVAGVPVLGAALSFLAAVAAAIVPILGRDILAVGREGSWIRARACAEALKSECFLFAAGVDPYVARDAASVGAFYARCDAITVDATKAGLAPLLDPVSEKEDARRPALLVTSEWYRANRLREQLAYYAGGQARHERAVGVLRAVTFGAAIAAAVLGVTGSMLGQQWFAPRIGAMTTATAAV